MGKSYAHVKAMAQPDRTACWSTSLAWWTHTLPKVKDYDEVDIMGMYNHLTGSDGGLRMPDGYTSMLKDPIWGMKVENWGVLTSMSDASDYFKSSPVMCGYYDWTVGGYHSVALYGFKLGKGVWAMDPNGGQHVFRPFAYYFSLGKRTIVGFVDNS